VRASPSDATARELRLTVQATATEMEYATEPTEAATALAVNAMTADLQPQVEVHLVLSRTIAMEMESAMAVAVHAAHLTLALLATQFHTHHALITQIVLSVLHPAWNASGVFLAVLQAASVSATART